MFVCNKASLCTSNANDLMTSFKDSQQRVLDTKDHAAERTASKSIVGMSVVGANRGPAVDGMETLPDKINYFRGNDQAKWITGVPTFKKVAYAQVYPGIDLVYYGKFFFSSRRRHT